MKDIKMNRRTFLQGTGAIGAVALMGAPTILRAAPLKITFGHGAAAGNPRSIAADKFAELVKARSGGAIEVAVAGSAMLGDDAAMLTSLRTGTLGISANSQGATSSVVPELAALGMPFLFAKSADGVKVLNGKIGDLLKPKFDALGLVPIGWWDNGIRHITNSKRAIKTPEDLKGLKFRTPPDPATIDIFQALGAATAQIAFSELYLALQQGVVDGQENPLTNIASAKIYEVNPFISLSAHKWECNPVLMSKMAWNRLDAKSKDIVMEAMAECTTLQINLSEEANTKLLREFRANKALTVSEVDLAAFRKQTASVFDKWANEKPFGAFVKDLRKTVLG
ncbi:DctP family TRAP transporter solute-binding subunit [Propionivibrio dicarboxylicus]|uniref:Tripartite ATP-independent transporter solute receptor, DctP family n=1 Tax=Propionivibrio dicarboxylicus TaxID=83767 RepID=A0A1G8H8H8_9RHOO|nr:DctP family TRAP transporter solute-binding subunit [Propionivibrio dicarboxylicus]SDI02841.1 tripartite ATP-independent transporter solute receptor, DctP family [Propionivibrio dicarboxylicus]